MVGFATVCLASPCLSAKQVMQGQTILEVLSSRDQGSQKNLGSSALLSV